MMENSLFEEFDVLKINRTDNGYTLEEMSKPVITEISLKIFVNDMETASLLCLNQKQEELAIGFLFSEGVINSYDDIADIYYNDRALAVMVTLKDGISVRRQESLRSITAGCGKCFTYINPLKQSQYSKASSSKKVSLEEIMSHMQTFTGQSDVFRLIGGVHSLLFYTPEYTVFCEDIGRHNCLDKVAGTLLREGKRAVAEDGIVFISGRVTSEIMTKIIRLGVPVLVSKSTPSAAAVKLANQYGITLLGYTRSDTGYVYSGAERLIEAAPLPADKIAI